MELQPNGTVTAVEYVNVGAKMERDSGDDKAAKQVRYCCCLFLPKEERGIEAGWVVFSLRKESGSMNDGVAPLQNWKL